LLAKETEYKILYNIQERMFNLISKIINID